MTPAGRQQPASLPSLAQLCAARGQTVWLLTPGGQRLAATLTDAVPGVAMNEHFRCYSAEFMLAPDTQLPQAVYHLLIGEADWPLLMTPVGLAAERRGRLQAVFHTSRDTEPAPESHA